MEYLIILIPTALAVIGGIIHLEVTIAILKNDVKWIKQYLNKEEK